MTLGDALIVLVAGFVGMAKFDWLFWLAGRRWGDHPVGVRRTVGHHRRGVHRVDRGDGRLRVHHDHDPVGSTSRPRPTTSLDLGP